MEYVTIKKKKIFVNNNDLYIANMDINSFSEIKKLRKHSNLKGLYLEGNKIAVMDRLNSLVNLSSNKFEGIITKQ